MSRKKKDRKFSDLVRQITAQHSHIFGNFYAKKLFTVGYYNESVNLMYMLELVAEKSDWNKTETELNLKWLMKFYLMLGVFSWLPTYSKFA